MHSERSHPQLLRHNGKLHNALEYKICAQRGHQVQDAWREALQQSCRHSDQHYCPLQIRLDDPAKYQSIVDAEWNIIYQKLDAIAASGAKVVLSRLAIGDLATQYFADRDIFCAGRVRSAASMLCPDLLGFTSTLCALGNGAAQCFTAWDISCALLMAVQHVYDLWREPVAESHCSPAPAVLRWTFKHEVAVAT